jgi:hypothetical protein
VDALLRPKSEAVGVLYLDGTAFRFADMDGDGQMSLQEAKVQGMTEQLFARMDANNDGNIQVSEFRRFVTDHAANSRAVAKARAAERLAKITAFDRIGSGCTEDGELVTPDLGNGGAGDPFSSFVVLVYRYFSVLFAIIFVSFQCYIVVWCGVV